MRKSHRIMIAGFIAVLALLFRYLTWMEIQVEGDTVRAQSQYGKFTLRKQGEPSEMIYSVAGVGQGKAIYFHASVPAIPMGLVEELTRKYGDFRKCDSPGAAAGQSSVIQLRLIGENDAAARKIDTARNLAKSLKGDILLRIKGTPLQTVDEKISNNKARYSLREPHEDILVTDIEAVQAMAR